MHIKKRGGGEGGEPYEMKFSRAVLERRFFELNDDCNECQLNPKEIMRPLSSRSKEKKNGGLVPTAHHRRNDSLSRDR